MRELIADVARTACRDAANNESRDLHSLVMDSCQAASVAEHPRIDIRVDIPPKIEIPLSLDRMKGVFANLIVNAIQAMPAGGIIRITAIETVHQLRIEVEDNGPGISAAIRDHLFEPWATANKKDGLGLGLMLSRQTVRELGGDLWCEPALGARFIISLPVHGRKICEPASRERGLG